MSRENVALAVFNRGIVDQRALARVDIKRVALAAEIQTNWIPRVIGSMTLRPGLEYIDSTRNDAEARHIPFVFSVNDTAIIEITDSVIRVRVDEQIIQRPSVSTTITNGNFTSDVSGWTDADEAGATSQFATGGYLDLEGTRFNAAIRRQEVTVAPADRNVEHGLKIVIERGPVTLKVGSTSGGDEYISETQLGAGEHSLAFTPTGNFHIELSSRTQYSVLVDSINVESSGDMTLTAPWKSGDLENIRWDQSADVIYVACDGYQQRKIERRGTRSWSIVKYEPQDGPFFDENITTLRLTPGALSGDTTLTASRALFRSTHVGALFKIRSIGQKVESAINGEGQFTSAIRVIGTGNSRIFTVNISGTWTATVTLQRSVDDQSSWTDVTTYTTNQSSVNFDDALSNQIVFYRIGIDTGDYTSGTATCTLTYSGGGITGICKVTSFTSSTSVNIAILNRLGQTTASEQWSEGLWSDFRGFPTSVALYEGRLWWAGQDRIVGSVSDAFESFDEDLEGDAGPINRTIGQGPVDFINFLLPLQRLIVGTESAEMSIRSSTQDEPLTPTNFNIKPASTQGSAPVSPARLDDRGIYVQRGGLKAYELAVLNLTSLDYSSSDLSVLVPDIGDPGIIHLAIQRQPDTRVHFMRADGTVALFMYLPTEDVRAWFNVETGDADRSDGVIEDVFVMPGDFEDVVYYVVRRQINGSTKRYLEKWALEEECIGGTYNCQADSFKMFINNPASATVSGLSHLEGESVVVWADGKCLRDASRNIATFTVSSGSITLTNAGSSYTASQGIVGLAYTAQYKSGKLPFAASLGTPLAQKQKITNIALILWNTHNRGLKFGRDFTNMDNLPRTIDGATADEDEIHKFITIPAVTFPGDTTQDARLFLEANAPRPATVAAAILGLATNERPA